MTRDEAHALAAHIEAALGKDTGGRRPPLVAVYRANWGGTRYAVHVYLPHATWVLHRACHWTRRN